MRRARLAAKCWQTNRKTAMTTNPLGTTALRPRSSASLSAGVAIAFARAVAGSARRPWRAPVLLWGLLLSVALMSFFVHLLNTQVLRGEKLREEQRAAATRPANRLALGGTLPPTNALSRQRAAALQQQ